MNIDLEVTDVSIDTEVDVADIEILASFDNPTSLSDLSSDSMHRVVTDEMISEWNSKQDELNYIPENISNKRGTLVEDNSNNYPTTGAVNAGLALKANTNHNHSLASLSERSYNSLTDKPNLDLLDNLIDVQYFRNTVPLNPSIGELLYMPTNKLMYSYIESGWYNIPFAWKFYLNTDSESDLYGKYFVYNGIELSIIPDGLVLGETSETAFDGERGMIAYNHTSDTNNPHYITAEQIGAQVEKGIDELYVSSAEKSTWSSKQPSLGFTPVNKAGDTMTGALIGTTIQASAFQDLNGNVPFKSIKGGVEYHSKPWFAPTQSVTISADGLSVTAAGAQFTDGSSQVGAMIEINGARRIITTPNPTTTAVYVTEAFPTAMRGQTYASGVWGVYNKACEIMSDGEIRYYYKSSGAPTTYLIAGSGALFNSQSINVANQVSLSTTLARFSKDIIIQWSNGNLYTETKDTGLSRNSPGVLEVNNGTAGTFRDLIVRDLTTSAGKLVYGANDSAGTGYRTVRVPNA